jgi:hypothetical protein
MHLIGSYSVVLLLIVPVQVYSQGDRVLTPEKIIALIPDRIKGFVQTEDPKARQTRLGDITYTLCEKKFGNGKRSIKILLFDYKEAPIMYNQVMREWGSRTLVDTDTLVFRSLIMQNCSGWESYNGNNKRSQIFLGICDRFFMMMTGENIDLEVLKRAFQEIPLKNFPE